MSAMKKNYIIISGFIIIFIIFLCYLLPGLSVKLRKSSLSPIPALSASQINNMEDFISLLEKTNSPEDRKKIFEENKELITKDLIITLLAKADSAFDKKHFLIIKESQHLTEIAVEAAEFTGDTVTLGKALLYYSIFERFEKRDDYNPPCLKKALLLFKESGDRTGEASCYYRQAKNIRESSAPASRKEKAFELLDKTLIIAGETKDYLLEGDCFYMKGEIYGYFTRDKDKSIENFNKATGIYKKNGDVMSILRSYQTMFDICENNGFLEEAKKYLEIKKQLIDEMKPDKAENFSGKKDAYLFRDEEFRTKEELMADYYYSHSILCWLSGRYEEAIKYYKKTIDEAQKLPETGFTEIYAYLGMGRTYLSIGKKESALKYYLEAGCKVTPHMDINLATCIYVRLAQ